MSKLEKLTVTGMGEILFTDAVLALAFRLMQKGRGLPRLATKPEDPFWATMLDQCGECLGLSHECSLEEEVLRFQSEYFEINGEVLQLHEAHYYEAEECLSRIGNGTLTRISTWIRLYNGGQKYSRPLAATEQFA